jgi:hypothetical protein
VVWKILRPHYWILDRRVRSTNRFVVVALILLVGFGGQWAYNTLVRDNLALLNSEQAITAVASFLPVALFLLLLFALLGVGDVTHQLYLAPDVELLMVAPVPFRTLFLVKLLHCSRATLIPGLGIGAFLLALGLARAASPSYYLLVGLLIVSAMALATAAVMVLVILLARFLPAQKTRSWLPVGVVAATLLLMLGQQAATRWFLGQTGMIAFLVEALLNPDQLSVVVAGFGGLSVVAILAAFRIFDTSFHEGWNRFREVPTQRRPISRASGWPWRVSRLAQPLPAPLRFVLMKEWLELTRKPRAIISLAQPLALAVVVLVPFIGVGGGSDVLRPLIFWYVMVLLVLFLTTLPLGLPLMAVAEEGRNMALLRSAPISMSEVLKGKFWATWVPVVLSWVLIFLLVGLWMRFPLWQVAFLVAITIWGLAGASVATMAIGGLTVDFTVEELRQRMPTGTSCLVMGLNMIFVLSTITLSVWLMARLFPGSPVVLAMQALASYGAVRWVFSETARIPLGLVSSQIVFWVGVKLLWDGAVRRLEAWEGI